MSDAIAGTALDASTPPIALLMYWTMYSIAPNSSNVMRHLALFARVYSFIYIFLRAY